MVYKPHNWMYITRIQHGEYPNGRRVETTSASLLTGMPEHIQAFIWVWINTY